jgi:hypothetical protein
MVEKFTAEENERYRRAREAALAEERDPSYVIRLRYDKQRDMIDLYFRCGGMISVPRRKVRGLEKGRVPGPITLSEGHDAVSCRAADVDHYIPGLIERVFGPRLFAAAIGARGGRQRSRAKTVAVRLNGRKGGRPRKQAVA